MTKEMNTHLVDSPFPFVLGSYTIKGNEGERRRDRKQKWRKTIEMKSWKCMPRDQNVDPELLLFFFYFCLYLPVQYLWTSMTFQISPDWEIENLFVAENIQSVMELDSLESSHPISVPVEDPDEINQLFDGISYDKGRGKNAFFLGV